jgi:hypothetical protein
MAMPFKPMKLRDYQKLIREYGWVLVKGSIDWILMGPRGQVVVKQIKVTHPGNEVSALSVKKTHLAINNWTGKDHQHDDL